MTLHREMIPAAIRAVGDDLDEFEVEVVMSTGAIARDGHILEPGGADLDAYQRNPIILWQHDPKKPVGNATAIQVSGSDITARIRFAPAGASDTADEIRSLVKAGVVRAVSVGFDPIDGTPLDPKKPRGGQRFSKWQLLECSFVSVPADTGAVVTAREHQETEMTETTAVTTAARKPASVIRAHRGGIGVALKRGLYDIGRLAWLLDSLCDAHWSAKIESALEGDDSAVPGMIAEAMQDLGAALVAMTAEEVSEALAAAIGTDVEDDDDGEGLDTAATTVIVASANPGLKRFRIGFCRAAQIATRAGKKHSAATVATLRDMKADHEEGLKSSRAAMRAHQRGLNRCRSLLDDACDCSSDPDDENYDPDCDCDDRSANAETDTKQVQTSNGVAESGGSSNDRAAAARRLRERDLLALSSR